jgi:predicted acetyltransferase
MTLEIVPATREHADILARLWPLYQYDMSEVGGTPINAHGLFEDESMRVHDYRADLESWWRNADGLHPYLIRVDSRAAGLVLVGDAPRFAPADVDHAIVEFFVLRGFRGGGIGREVAEEIFRRYPGRWELQVFPANAPALAFWRKVIGGLVGEAFSETVQYIEEDEEDMVVMRFEIKGDGSRNA